MAQSRTGTEFLEYQMGHTRNACDKVQKTLEATVSEKRVRVLLANGPRLMRELVYAVLAEQSDIDVIGEIENHSELGTAIEQSRPDALIIWYRREHYGSMRVSNWTIPSHEDPGPRARAESRSALWAIVEFRTKPVESSEACFLSALREHPCFATVHQ